LKVPVPPVTVALKASVVKAAVDKVTLKKTGAVKSNVPEDHAAGTDWLTGLMIMILLPVLPNIENAVRVTPVAGVI
jgi:hypothetical protein